MADGLTYQCRDCRRGDNARYRAENADRIAVRRARYYREHRDEVRAQQKEYVRTFAGREAGSRKTRVRRARLAGARTCVLSARFERRLLLAGCFYCGAGDATTVDHVVPLARGGDHSEGNLVACCSSCNSSKGSRLLVEWRLKDR